MSRIDELTCVYNRRGFYSAASELIKKHGKGREYIICYADMDNLKMVNDRYGHTEGDFSIRSLADCLREIFGDMAVVGRMGGDEFAAVLPAENTLAPEDILRRRQESIDRLPFLQIQTNLPSQTFRWNVWDITTPPSFCKV